MRYGLVGLVAAFPMLAATAVPAAAQDPAVECPTCAERAELIERFGLREGRTAVRERPDWAPPTRIVTHVAWAEDLLGTHGGGAEVVVVRGAQEMMQAIPSAQVYFGFCFPDLIRAATELQWIQLPSAGAESCASIPEIAERDILVTNAQRIYGPQIAEHVMAMVFSFARGLHRLDRAQPGGGFDRGVGQWELGGKTLLVVGLGGIGTEVAVRANALGMRVIATRNSRREGPDYVDYVGLAHEAIELAAQADVVVNATPLTPETRGMFDRAFFEAMKPEGYFINVGRGASVVTGDLVRALREGHIAGAGLDVTDPEPLPQDHPLRRMPDVILTPHVAGGSDLQLPRLSLVVIENLVRYIAGDALLSLVDVSRGY